IPTIRQGTGAGPRRNGQTAPPRSRTAGRTVRVSQGHHGAGRLGNLGPLSRCRAGLGNERGGGTTGLGSGRGRGAGGPVAWLGRGSWPRFPGVAKSPGVASLCRQVACAAARGYLARWPNVWPNTPPGRLCSGSAVWGGCARFVSRGGGGKRIARRKSWRGRRL